MTTKTSDARLTNLFLDMLAAEQGAGNNTLDAYRRDLEDFSNFLTRAGLGFADAGTQALRDYLADLDSPRLQVVERGAAAVGDAASVSLSAQRTHPKRRSCSDSVRPETRPQPAESAVDLRRRSPADARQNADRCTESLCRAATSRAAIVLPARTALRHRPAGVGACRIAAFGGAARCAHDRGARQGQQGTAGAAQRTLQAGDGRLPRRDGSSRKSRRRKTPPPQNGCSRPSARAGI